jgi:hypothetical protein
MSRWEERLFDRGPEGWTFNATSLVFGAPRFYRVDDAQKAALVARLRRARWFMPLILLAVVAVGFAAFGSALVVAGVGAPPDAMTARTPLAMALFFVAMLVMGGLMIAIMELVGRLAVAPVLTGAPRIDLRFGLMERLELMAAAMSVKARVAQVLVYIFFGAAWAWLGWSDPRGGAGQFAVAGVTALFVLLQLALLAIQLRSRRAA